MAREFSADDVLKVAEKMERNAVKFYRKAAGICDDPKIGKVFVDLARWERRHARVFADMREGLSDVSWSDKARQNPDLARFILDVLEPSEVEPPLPLVFGDRENPPSKLVGKPTKVDVLKVALQKEKDTIAYFTRLQALVPGPGNAQAIEAVVREEERHVKILMQSLEQVL
ncbi:MAG: ferritin family protein [Sedimentisphaerales bacterium]|nr:ferritin family protein [Sedimentisphaerales bacterium]